MRSRHLPVIGTALLLTVIVGGAAAGGYWRFAPTAAPAFDPPVVVPPPPPPGLAPSIDAVPPGTETASTPWFLIAVLAVVLVLLVIGAVHAVRRMLAGRLEPMEDMDPDIPISGVHAAADTIDLPVLVDAVEAALARLDATAAPGDAVVAAWVLLEEAAAAHGWERHPSQTSTEFTAQLLDVSPAPPEHTATLRGLYQRARFTDHPITAEHVARARAALAAIARALDGAPA